MPVNRELSRIVICECETHFIIVSNYADGFKMSPFAPQKNLGSRRRPSLRTMSLIAPRSERARWTRIHRARPDRGAISDIGKHDVVFGQVLRDTRGNREPP